MKLILKILLISLFFSLIFMGFISCGARKSNVEKQKEETNTELKDNSVTEKQSETNIKTDTSVKVDDKNETITEETILEPSDNTKESFIIEKDGTKTILNNAKKTVRKTIKNNNTQTNKSGNAELVKKETVNEQKYVSSKEVSKKENKSKETDRKATPWYYYLLLLVPISFVYLVGKRYKMF